MEHVKKYAVLAFAALLSSTYVSAREPESQLVPDGHVVYSLPATVLRVEAQAESESFVAGPYAEYAKKYLGVEARRNDALTYRLVKVSVTPYVEADPSARFVVRPGTADNVSDILNMTAQGLVSVMDGTGADKDVWKYSGLADSEKMLRAGATSNLSERTTTLYTTVRTADGISKVPVKQSQVVEKSVEKKASETASLIFMLRQKRIDIITGNTDAIFDGEAMGAVLSEISRLENEYLELFFGRSVVDTQRVVFDVIPSSSPEKQNIIAFRFSALNGILPVSDISGSPVVMELSVMEDAGLQEESRGKAPKNAQFLKYRIPADVSVRLLNGTEQLMTFRVPVYQMGRTVSIPLYPQL